MTNKQLRLRVIHDGDSMPIIADQFGRWFRVQQHRDSQWVHPFDNEVTEHIINQQTENDEVLAANAAAVDRLERMHAKLRDVIADGAVIECECYRRGHVIVQMTTERDNLRAALRALLKRDQGNTCQHENTHRGGTNWEICDTCGAKWADDEGGRPEWQDPPEWSLAEEALAN
jgi:hypothetical protein